MMPASQYQVPDRVEKGITMQPQWTVEADGGAAPLTMQVAQVTVATGNGDQITLVPEQVGPLVHRLDCIDNYLAYGDD
ncbi:MAG: hypothetical protein ACRDRP_20780 [Pseudonocardiaceae bacterium]